MAKKKDSLTTAVSAEIKSNFNLEKFKEKKLLTGNVKFKEQKWIPFSEALQESVSLPGAPMGHITLLRGHSNTGKTTALLELAINAQKMGILPVFIITEMKWSWEHAKQMGFQVEDVVDTETGEIVWKPRVSYPQHHAYKMDPRGRSQMAFSEADRVAICLKRKMRREIIHALGLGGRLFNRHPKRNYLSNVRC